MRILDGAIRYELVELGDFYLPLHPNAVGIDTDAELGISRERIVGDVKIGRFQLSRQFFALR